MVDLKITLPEGFLDEEERCGYTVTHKMKEVWAVELDLLAEFQRVCKKYSIRYFADGGTILGAIRHGGFIPWDDDIDIAMFRKDYEILCTHSDEFKHPYFFQTNDSDPGSLRGHAQLRNSNTTGALKCETDLWINQGIFIDIFPLDSVCDNAKEFEIHKKRIVRLKSNAAHFGRWCTKPNGKIKRIVKQIINLIPFPSEMFLRLESKYYHCFEEECQRYNGIDTKNISLLSFNCTWDRLIRKRSLYKSVIIAPFEFMKVPIPIGYEEVLKNLYGDYHKIVMNASAHGGVIFDAGVQYKDFMMKNYNNKFYIKGAKR